MQAALLEFEISNCAFQSRKKMSLKTVISEGNVETQVVSLTFPSKRLADIVKKLGPKILQFSPLESLKL